MAYSQKKFLETIPEEAQALDLLGKDFKSIILNMLKEFKQHNQLTILADIYRTLYIKTIAFTIFSNEYEAFSMIDHMLGYKCSLHRCKNVNIIKVTSLTITDESQKSSRTVKSTKSWKLKTQSYTTNGSKNKSQGKFRKYLEINEKLKYNILEQ